MISRTATPNPTPVIFVLFAALMLALSMNVQADQTQRFWLVGDSFSSEPDSWAEQLDDIEYAFIQNLSVEGARLIDVTMPTWLNCDRSEVILRIGTNDAGSGVSDEDFENKLRKHLNDLTVQQCKVWLVLPLHLTHLGSAVEQATLDKRAITDIVSREYQNVTLLDPPYDHTKTVDGLHPTTGAQSWTAIWFASALGLTPPE